MFRWNGKGIVYEMQEGLQFVCLSVLGRGGGRAEKGHCSLYCAAVLKFPVQVAACLHSHHSHPFYKPLL